MENNDEYELLPHKEIIELRRELERLKKNPLGKGRTADNLLDAITILNESINSLIYTFQHATDSLKEEQTSKKEETDLHPLITKMNQLIEQNKELAEGIVSVAEMMKKERKEIRVFEDRIQPFTKRYEQKPQPITPTPVFGQEMTPPPGNPNPMPNFPQSSPFGNIPASSPPPFGNTDIPSPLPELSAPTRTPKLDVDPISGIGMPPPPDIENKKKGFLSFGK